MAGIYLHIPYCSKACYYCDFHFSTNLKSKQDMVKAMLSEISLRDDYLGRETIETIYCGGGTPSLLSQNDLIQFMDRINEHFTVVPNSEVTLEANPDDITPSYLNDLLEVGITRISLGTQSFHESHLALLNRSHTSVQARSSLELIKQAGFKNYTADLIYGIPSPNHNIWKADIEQMLSFDPPHLSCYNLTVEPNTVFGKWSVTGKFKEADDAFAYEQFDLLMNRLSEAGYEHYEISNFAKPRFRSIHNSNYWNGKKYLGIGPGAHSYDLSSRQSNISNNALYIKAINQGKVPCEIESLSRIDQINEFVMTAIRTSDGINVPKLAKHYGYDLIKEQSATIQQIEKEGYIEMSNSRITLTRQGKFLADAITERLFID